MIVEVVSEYGENEALFGLGLSYALTSKMKVPELADNAKLKTKLTNVAKSLAPKDGGHNKVLEHLTVYLDITAARYWWQQFDTYRIDVSRQSESTMHTLTKRQVKQDDFEMPVDPIILAKLNEKIRDKNFVALKNELPEGFLQRRIVKLSYKSIRNIIKQRNSHRLAEWQHFCISVFGGLKTPEYLGADIAEIIDSLDISNNER